MTHEDLRKMAVHWLTMMRCSVVLSEMRSLCLEVPDAVGWKGGMSYLVECKVSRSDWKANAEKAHARCGRGVGRLRYVLCPKDLLTVADMEGTDYGLLYFYERGSVQQIKAATPREPCERDEITMLVSALRRVRTREFLTINILPKGGPDAE